MKIFTCACLLLLLSGVAFGQNIIYVAKPTKWTGSSGRTLLGNLNGNIHDLGFFQKADGVDNRDLAFYNRVYSVSFVDAKFKAAEVKQKEIEANYQKEIKTLQSEISSLKKELSTLSQLIRSKK